MKLLTLLASLLVLNSFGQVWYPANSWFSKDQDGKFLYEEKFAEFVRNKEVVNVETLALNGIEIDCADLYITNYLIFAAIHKLPVYIEGSGNHITNLTKKFNRYSLLGNAKHVLIKEGGSILSSRLIEFIKDVTHHYIDTNSLQKNSFIISLEAEYLKEGVIYVKKKKAGASGHTQIVSKLSRENDEFPIHMINVSVPREIKDAIFESPYFTSELPSLDFYTFRKFYPAINQNGEIRRAPLSALREMGYDSRRSQLNYQFEKFNFFSLDLSWKVNPEMSVDILLKSLFSLMREKIYQRDGVVMDAYRVCVTGHLDCNKETNYRNWDNYSTPSRDKDLRDLITANYDLLKEAAITYNDDSIWAKYNNDSDNEWILITYEFDDLKNVEHLDLDLMKEEGFELYKYEDKNTFRIRQSLTITNVLRKISNQELSSEPEENMLTRWGFRNFLKKNIPLAKINGENNEN